MGQVESAHANRMSLEQPHWLAGEGREWLAVGPKPCPGGEETGSIFAILGVVENFLARALLLGIIRDRNICF